MIDMKGGYGVPYKKSIDRLVVDGMSVETLKALLLDDLDSCFTIDGGSVSQ